MPCLVSCISMLKIDRKSINKKVKQIAIKNQKLINQTSYFTRKH